MGDPNMVPKIDLLSETTDGLAPKAVPNPRGGMFLNMEQVHRANKMDHEMQRSPKTILDGIETVNNDSIGAPTVDVED